MNKKYLKEFDKIVLKLSKKYYPKDNQD